MVIHSAEGFVPAARMNRCSISKPVPPGPFAATALIPFEHQQTSSPRAGPSP